METESVVTSLVNIGSAFGVPVLVLAAVFYLFMKFFPKWLEAYSHSKKSEQEAFAKRQEHYDIQTNRIIEVATLATTALENNTKAWTKNNEMFKETISSIIAMKESINLLNESFKEQAHTFGDMNIKVHQILENIRERENNK